MAARARLEAVVCHPKWVPLTFVPAHPIVALTIISIGVGAWDASPVDLEVAVELHAGAGVLEGKHGGFDVARVASVAQV